MQPSSKVDRVVWAAAAVFIFGVVARVAFLGADPTYPFWSGWVADEGRWVGTARDIVLFGAPVLDTALARTHLILGPLYQALSSLVFWVLGVGSVQARLLSVVTGLGILLVTALFLRRRLPPRVAWATLALLAVQPDLVYFSRVAIPEMTSLFFEVCAFALLVGGPRTLRKAFLSGLVTAVALGAKGTTAPVVAAFAVVILLVHRPTDPGGRLSRLVAFLSAIVVPGLVFLTLVGLRSPAGGGLGDILAFVQLDDAYGMLATLFEGGWTLRVNLILIGVWGLGLVSWLRRIPESEARAIFVGSVVWVGGSMVPWALLIYFPERYVMHIHVPLILALGSGYALLADDRGASLRDALGRVVGAERIAVSTLLAVPTAVLSAPFLLSMVDVVGPTIENLRYQLPTIAGLSVIVGRLLRARWRETWVIGVGLGFPLSAGALWAVARSTGTISLPFWSIDGAGTGLIWGFILGAAALVTATAVRPRESSASMAPRIVGVFAMVVALLWVGQGAARLQARHYVLREVAEYLVESYPPSQLIGSRGASSLLLQTPFAYQDLPNRWEMPDVVVTYWTDEQAELLVDYELVREFDLDVGAGFADTYRSTHLIRIYERR